MAIDEQFEKSRLEAKFRAGAESRAAEIAALKSTIAELQRFKPIGAMIVVSRKWHQPLIRVQHFNDGISIDMGVPDFTRALMLELKEQLPQKPDWYERIFSGEMAWRVYAEALEKAIVASIDDIINEMKMATVHAPPPVPPPGP
jgi:hypothetical protein